MAYAYGSGSLSITWIDVSGTSLGEASKMIYVNGLKVMPMNMTLKQGGTC